MGELLRGPSAPRARLRELLADGSGPLLAPGAYDALSARLVEEAGFDVVYMTGFGTTASLIGRPDVGLLSGAEMIDNARRMVAAVDMPVIADADTGYGNAINVIRTVENYESAGLAAMHIEDQVSPKRCGHVAGKVIVSLDEAVGKLRAALDARRDKDFLIIARTDAVAAAGAGFDEAVRRGKAFAQAGADM
ncbi:isocitrate lyase/PEP mutase family protein, partial [Pseudonocardia sp.]|uniref:isocitrate lyase/PEP mutase family protein n=1 Tax=Pseudonocardia sp. TaxID=60912 RepID=UPI0031FD01FE